jgi:hypothetical protein
MTDYDDYTSPEEWYAAKGDFEAAYEAASEWADGAVAAGIMDQDDALHYAANFIPVLTS